MASLSTLAPLSTCCPGSAVFLLPSPFIVSICSLIKYYLSIANRLAYQRDWRRGSYPELPYDSTCLFRQIPATGELEISIVAGPSGISPFFYRFSLLGTNPPQAVLFTYMFYEAKQKLNSQIGTHTVPTYYSVN